MSQGNNSMAAQLIANRGNRTLASLLGWLELHVKDQLSEGVWDDTRSMVLSSVNEFKDLAIDIVKSDTAMMNQHWVEKLEQLHDDLRFVKSKVT